MGIGNRKLLAVLGICGASLSFGHEAYAGIDVSKTECPAVVKKLEGSTNGFKVAKCLVERAEPSESEGEGGIAVWISVEGDVFEKEAPRRDFITTTVLAAAPLLEAPNAMLMMSDSRVKEDGKWLSLVRLGPKVQKQKLSEPGAKELSVKQDGITPALKEARKVGNARLLGRSEDVGDLWVALQGKLWVATVTKNGMTLDPPEKQ